MLKRAGTRDAWELQGYGKWDYGELGIESWGIAPK